MKSITDHQFAFRFLLVLLPLALAMGCGSAEEELAEEVAGDDEKSAPVEAGVFLGKFDLLSHHPSQNETLSLNFSLYATVDEDKRETLDQLVKVHENRLRDQIIIATRLMQLHQLDDPELLVLRRRIQSRLRRVLPQLAMRNIYFNDFQFHVD